MKYFFLNRLKEPSTWRGVVLVATGFGIHATPEQTEAIVSLGIALAGVLGIVSPDKLRK